MPLETVCVKTEVEDVLVEDDPEKEMAVLCVKKEADSEDLCRLYEDHQVKDELMLGPVLIHRPHAASIQVNRAEPAKPRGRACSVRLERLLLDTERGACRVGRHTYKLRAAGAVCEDTVGVRVKEDTHNVRSCNLLEHQVHDELVPGPVLIHQHHVSSVQASVSRAEPAGCWGRACSVRLQRLLPGAGRGRRTGDTSEPQPPHHSTDTSSTAANYELSDSKAVSLAQPRGLARSVRPERLVRRLPHSRRTDNPRHVSASERAPTQPTYQYQYQHQYQCHHCGEHCSNKALLITHIHAHSLGPSRNSIREEFDSDCQQTIHKRIHRQSAHLRTHEMINTEKTPFKCNLCEYKCKQKTYLSIHLRIHTGEKPFRCKHCDHRFRQRAHLRTHEMTHTGDKPFTCNHCNYKSNNNSALQTHLRIHTGEKPFECRYCDYRSNRRSHLREHEMRHTGEKPFKCGYCDFRSRHRTHLRTHEMIHTGEKPFKCNHCEYKCNQSSTLQTHLRIHTGEKPFKCEYCDYRCRQKSHLRTHEKIHTKETPYKCEYKSSQKTHLRTHMGIHTGEKPFRCKHCDFRSRHRTHLRTHEMIHTGEKPFKCNHCDYKCNQSSTLRVHLRIHTGEKPFQCEYCDYRCINKSALRTHSRIHTVRDDTHR